MSLLKIDGKPGPALMTLKEAIGNFQSMLVNLSLWHTWATQILVPDAVMSIPAGLFGCACALAGSLASLSARYCQHVHP